MGEFAGFRQFKANHHIHTTNSDGRVYPYNLIEDYYRRGYDILAITDHWKVTSDWRTIDNGITQQRWFEMRAGVGRAGRGMLTVPSSMEWDGRTRSHFNCFLWPEAREGLDATWNSNLQDQAIGLVASNGGFVQINHLAWTGGAGINVDPYVTFIRNRTQEQVPVMENVTWWHDEGERRPWDNVNRRMLELGGTRMVWGLGNDDSHSDTVPAPFDDHDFCFSMFLMRENTETEWLSAMRTGRHYSVSRNVDDGGVPAASDVRVGWRRRAYVTPIINDIIVSGSTITINAEHYNRIDWKSPTSTAAAPTIATGNTVDISVLSGLGPFIRANVINANGSVAFTQPYRISSNQIVPH